MSEHVLVYVGAGIGIFTILVFVVGFYKACCQKPVLVEPFVCPSCGHLEIVQTAVPA